MRDFLSLGSRFLLLLASLLFACLPAIAANPAVRILPLGDSITKGCCSGTTVEGGYRTQLYTLLVNAGYTVDFLGTLQDVNSPPGLPDPDHEGHGGYRIAEIDSGSTTWLSEVEDPDVILLMIGINDYWQNFDTANAASRLNSLITHLATARPFAKIIVANLTLFTVDPNVDNAVQTTYNANIPTIVANQAALGRQVYFLDMRSCCGEGDLNDGVHPNLTGYDKMGAKWFGAVTNLIGPLGTADRPALVRAKGQIDLRHVAVTFSKPISDSSAAVGNFGISGGVNVLGASLDSSKRVITLTTSLQAVNTSYTITATSGVTDRTAQANTLINGSTVTFVSGPVAEAANYSLAYSLKVPNQAAYNASGVDYSIDNHGSLGAFSRVAYYLEVQPQSGGAQQYLWVSMNAFTSDAGRIGVPSVASGAFFQQSVSSMNVRSSVAGITTGDGLSGGNLEFWAGDYGPNNAANVPGASSTAYDWGDGAIFGDPAGYGSMQVNNSGAGQTLFAFNGWGGAGLMVDVGIGNNSGNQRDWTLMQNATNYTSKLLEVYVQSASNPVGVPVITTQPSSLTVGVNGNTAFSVVASGTGPFTYQWRYNGTAISGATAASYTLNNVQVSNSGSYDVVVSNGAGPVTSSAAVLTVTQTGILANGSFESGYTGWMYSGNQGIAGAPYQVNDGVSLIAFNAGNTIPDGVLLQSFVTIPGVTYTLDFDVGVFSFSALEQRIQVTVQGSDMRLSQTVSLNGAGTSTTQWTPQSYAFVANSSVSTLTFRDVSPTSSGIDLLLDHVRVTSQARMLTIGSINPSSGLSVGVSPAGFNAVSGGLTSFQVAYAGGTTVTVTAPASVGNNVFQKWQRDGVDAGTNPSTSVLMDADHALTAIYVPVRFLTVDSVNPASGVTVSVSPAATNGVTSGPTSLLVAYLNGTTVTVTAPASVGNNVFQKWQKDGVDAGTNPSTSVLMDADHTLTALYVPVQFLTVDSINPSSGVTVSVSPAATNGVTSGPTSLLVAYLNGTTVTVTAPASVGNNVFQKWQKDGVDAGTNPSTSVVMDADHTLTAIYIPVRFLTVDSVNPSSGVSVSVSPAATNGVTSGPTSLLVAYLNGTTVTVTAPASVGNNVFQKWQKDGVDAGTNPSTSVVMDADHTLTAIYIPVRFLTVDSVNPSSGVTVNVSPAATNGVTSGPTSLLVAYLNGTTVTVTAPASVGNNVFQKWQKGGVDAGTDPGTSVLMDADQTLTALYVTVHTLTIDSLNPSSGVSVDLSPAATGGVTGGPTSLQVAYASGTVVELVAPASVGSRPFLKWQKDGSDYSASASTNIVLNADSTVVAVYASSFVAAHIFYNNSAWDLSNPAAEVGDDNAIASDKVPLLPGQTATFANYTSYSRGINGIMVDIASLPGTPTASDFTFKVGNDSTPSGWGSAPPPTTVALRSGAGLDGSDRITIIWPDKSIQKQWLEVRVKATPATGLAADEVFFFGNAVGDVGDAPAANGRVKVNTDDEVGVRLHPRNLINNPAPVDDRYDFNRDRKVNTDDEVIARLNPASFIDGLVLISPSSNLSLLNSGFVSGRIQDAPGPGALSAVPGPDLRILSTGPTGVRVQVNVSTRALYQLQTTDDLGSGNWQVLARQNIQPDQGWEWVMPLDPLRPNRFFRILLLDAAAPE